VPVKASTRSDDRGLTALPRALLSRFEHLLRELGKFGVVGLLSYAVDLGLFNYFRVGLHLEPLTSKTLSTAVAATVAFTGNRFWTWRHRQRSGLGREYSLYFLFNAVGLGIGLACLALSHYALGAVWPPARSLLADNISQGVVGMALGTMFRFWSYRRFVFRDPTVGPTPAPGSDAPA
jgi:putative flippase GtrA